MASAYSRLKTLVQAAADATGDNLHKWLLGDPAQSSVRFPAAWSHSTRMRERGSLWGQLIFPSILTQLGVELDTFGICWANISTNATGVAPTVIAGSQVTSVAKNETLNYLTPTFSIDYTGVNDFICLSILETTPSHPAIMGRATDTVTIGYFDNASIVIPINSRTVYFLAIGLR